MLRSLVPTRLLQIRIAGHNFRQSWQPSTTGFEAQWNGKPADAGQFYNVVEQTRIMKSLMRQGWEMTWEDVAFLTPYVTSHVKRFRGPPDRRGADHGTVLD